jgi:hypothetical protein
VGLPDVTYQVTGSAVEAIAARMAVTAARWEKGSGGSAFSVTMHSPIMLADGPAPVRITVAGVPGEVTLEPDRAGGSVVRAAIPLQRILAAAPVGGRHDLRVTVDAGGEQCERPVRVHSTVPRPHTISRLGRTFYRAGASKDRHGHLVLDVVPVTGHKVVGRVTKIMRQRKKRS